MWFSKSKEEVLKELNVDPIAGLTSKEAQKRLDKYGENKLKSKAKKSLLSLFFAQLNDMLIYVLLAATIITLLIGEYIDAAIIILVVLVNAFVGVIEEFKAEKAIEALQQMTNPKTLVRRDGKVQEINSEDIVPGDIVVIDAGRFIPADIRLLDSVNLQIEESALTGESVPTNKNAKTIHLDPKTPIGDLSNMLFMSTLSTYGRGEGVVVGTGMDTEMGSIAKALDEEVDEMTPLQRRLDELGKALGIICVGICVLIFIIALIQGRPLFEMFLTAISLAVAAIPEGLAAIVAIVLSLGVTKMSKNNAIVRKLPAVETLGSVNIICSDKTGTLTQNKMTVVKHFVMNHLKDIAITETDLEGSNDEKELIKSFVLCSDASYENGKATGDPTEIALIVLGNQHNMTKDHLTQKHKRVGEKPFDSDRKLMSTLNKEGNRYRVHTKGAIDNILQISTHALVEGKVIPLTEQLKQEYLKVASAMSNKALRVLAAAYKDVDRVIDAEDMESGLILIGLAAMIDPPRVEVKDSIKKAKMAGITPIMITGDHKNTAFAIAKQLDMAESMNQCLTGPEIDQMSDEEFSNKINNFRVFSRVSPEHKVKIVKAFKSQGNIVSMTGDGVNDAPSLKNADIGVAMGITGTDVSKGASDMILTDDNFSTIVHAVEEGRNIYNNIKKAVIFLLSCNLGEVICIFLAILLNWPIPLVATQLLWVNLVTDSLPALALGMDPGDKDVMKEKPRDPKESFFSDGAGFRAVLGGVLIGLLTLGAFYFGLAEHGHSIGDINIPEEAVTYARTMAFVVLAVSQLFYSLSMRSATKSVFEIGITSNKFLIEAIVIGVFLQFIIISVPVLADAFSVQMLTLFDWGIVMGFSLIPFLVNEIVKGVMTIDKPAS